MCDYYQKLKRYKRFLTKQQYSVLKGQIKCGQGDAAMVGLKTILNRKFGGVPQ